MCAYNGVGFLLLFKARKQAYILHAVTTSVFYQHILANSCIDKTVV